MNPRAVVVDDSLTVRMDIGEALQSAGFEIDLCSELASARAAVRRGRCAVIVLDVVLPDGDGLDFLKELKRDPVTRVIPVLLLSNEAEVAGRVRGMGAGADEYVGKPYDLVQVVARARALAGAAGRRAADASRRVLVIDDSLTYRSRICEVVRAAGYEVDEAATGEEGLARIAAARPDAVIVDGQLPGIDGATVVRRLKSDTALRSTPCLLLTAAEGSDDELRSFEAGADAYLRKTEDLEVLVARLAALLRDTRTGRGDSAPSLLGPKRILAVDDSPTYLEELGEELRREGHDVVLASSGEEALELLAVQSVDCIFLDLTMPGLSGHETCRHIKATPAWRDIPLVMLTARGDREAVIEGINAGADDYITKAADFGVLKARLRAQLRRKHFESETRRQAAEEQSREYTQVLERANRELEAAKEQAERSSRTKSSFLANMSHELRTPLNAIIGFAELLYDGQVQPEMPEHREFLGDILTSGRHLLQLINDILDLSKVEAGKLELHPEPVQLRTLVAEVLGILRTAAADKRIRIATEIDPALSDIVLDPARLKQVLYNYVSNALKFTPEGRPIVVRARPEGGSAFRLEVEDAGIGIAPDDVGRLFTDFEQLDSGAAKKHGGTGLGLALTRRLVEAQGGWVGVASVRGVGSTFHAVLPRRVSKGRPLPPPRVIAGPPGAPVVLVVEDREADQAQIVRALEVARYGVETAATGAQAIARCQERRFDAVTLDLLLPDASGLDVLRALRAGGHNQDVPVIVVTVVNERSVMGGLPVHDVLGKPIDEAELYDSLRRAGAGLTVLSRDGDVGTRVAGEVTSAITSLNREKA